MPKNKHNEGSNSLWTGAIRWMLRLRNYHGKDILIFLLFLGVSYGFWLILTLNDNTQRDIAVRLEIADVPDQTTFISDLPEELLVSIRDKGTVITNYTWGRTPTLKIKYNDFRFDERQDRIVIGEQQLNAQIRSIFGTSTQVVSVKPDSLSLLVTNRPPARVKVKPQIEVTPAPDCIVAGPVTVSPDSVEVFTVNNLADKLTAVRTVKTVRTEVNDSLVVTVRLEPKPGTRMVPDRVTLSVPVEPLIAKSRSVRVQLAHADNPSAVVLFPSVVKVSYLLPMSMYHSETNVITVTADYARHSNGRMPLQIGALPDYYRSVELSADSVEYLIEQPTVLPAPTPVAEE